MEYHDYDLLIWINRPVEQHFKEKILFDISKGMEHLHNLGLAHRDLKPQNILIKINKNDNNIIVKICDFETTRHAVTGSVTENKATTLYMAPEQEQDTPFSSIVTSKSMQKWDIWAFGLLIFFVFTGCQPKKPTLQYIKQKIEQKVISNPWQTIMFSCLELHPQERPTVPEILNLLNWE